MQTFLKEKKQTIDSKRSVCWKKNPSQMKIIIKSTHTHIYDNTHMRQSSRWLCADLLAKVILLKVVTLEYVNLCDANRKPREATHSSVSPLIIIPIFN